MEDPSEDFEDLRDKVDLRMLLHHPKFFKEAYAGQRRLTAAPPSTTPTKGNEGKESPKKAAATPMLGPPVRKKWAEKWRKELKIAKVSSCKVPGPPLILDGTETI